MDKQPCDWCKSTRWRAPLRSVREGLGVNRQTDYRAPDFPVARDAKLCRFCHEAAQSGIDRELGVN